MPTPRRRPSPYPTRRPYVAGRRKPGGGKSSPRPRPAPYSAQLEDLTGTEETAARTTEAVGAEETPTADAKAAGASAEPVEEQAAAEGAEPEARAAEVDDRAAEPAEPEPRRVPRSKSRDTGRLRPTKEEDVDTTAEPASVRPVTARKQRESGSSRRVPFWTAVVAAVVFAAFAGIAAWQYYSAADLIGNKAQIDPITTSQAKKEIDAAVETLFTYDYRDLDGRDDEVNELLASDKLRKQFATLNCAIQKQAPKQKTVSATKVSYSAVTALTDDTARAIVFVENMWERKSAGQTEKSSGSLAVTARLVDDQWKIADLEIHGGDTGEDPEVPQGCRE